MSTSLARSGSRGVLGRNAFRGARAFSGATPGLHSSTPTHPDPLFPDIDAILTTKQRPNNSNVKNSRRSHTALLNSTPLHSAPAGSVSNSDAVANGTSLHLHQQQEDQMRRELQQQIEASRSANLQRKKSLRGAEQKMQHVLHQAGVAHEREDEKLSTKVYYLQELSLAVQQVGPKETDVYLDRRYTELRRDISANLDRLSPAQLVSAATSFCRLNYQGSETWNMLAKKIERAVFGSKVLEEYANAKTAAGGKKIVLGPVEQTRRLMSGKGGGSEGSGDFLQTEFSQTFAEGQRKAHGKLLPGADATAAGAPRKVKQAALSHSQICLVMHCAAKCNARVKERFFFRMFRYMMHTATQWNEHDLAWIFFVLRKKKLKPIDRKFSRYHNTWGAVTRLATLFFRHKIDSMHPGRIICILFELSKMGFFPEKAINPALRQLQTAMIWKRVKKVRIPFGGGNKGGNKRNNNLNSLNSNAPNQSNQSNQIMHNRLKSCRRLLRKHEGEKLGNKVVQTEISGTSSGKIDSAESLAEQLESEGRWSDSGNDRGGFDATRIAGEDLLSELKEIEGEEGSKIRYEELEKGLRNRRNSSESNTPSIDSSGPSATPDVLDLMSKDDLFSLDLSGASSELENDADRNTEKTDKTQSDSERKSDGSKEPKPKETKISSSPTEIEVPKFISNYASTRRQKIRLKVSRKIPNWLTDRHIGSLALALARFDHYDERMLKTIARCTMLKELEMGDHSLALILYSFAKLRERHIGLLKFMEMRVLKSSSRTLNDRAVALMAYSFGKLGVATPDLWIKLCDLFVNRLDHHSPLHVANFVQALSKVVGTCAEREQLQTNCATTGNGTTAGNHPANYAGDNVFSESPPDPDTESHLQLVERCSTLLQRVQTQILEEEGALSGYSARQLVSLLDGLLSVGSHVAHARTAGQLADRERRKIEKEKQRVEAMKVCSKRSGFVIGKRALQEKGDSLGGEKVNRGSPELLDSPLDTLSKKDLLTRNSTALINPSTIQAILLQYIRYLDQQIARENSFQLARVMFLLTLEHRTTLKNLPAAVSVLLQKHAGKPFQERGLFQDLQNSKSAARRNGLFGNTRSSALSVMSGLSVETVTGEEEYDNENAVRGVNAKGEHKHLQLSSVGKRGMNTDNDNLKDLGKISTTLQKRLARGANTQEYVSPETAFVEHALVDAVDSWSFQLEIAGRGGDNESVSSNVATGVPADAESVAPTESTENARVCSTLTRLSWAGSEPRAGPYTVDCELQGEYNLHDSSDEPVQPGPRKVRILLDLCGEGSYCPVSGAELGFLSMKRRQLTNIFELQKGEGSNHSSRTSMRSSSCYVPVRRNEFLGKKNEARRKDLLRRAVQMEMERQGLLATTITV